MSLYNFPALNLLEVRESLGAFEPASITMVGLSLEQVVQVPRILTTQLGGERRSPRRVNDYAPDDVRGQQLAVHVSYSDFVRRMGWHIE